jgi:hypothetical protein
VEKKSPIDCSAVDTAVRVLPAVSMKPTIDSSRSCEYGTDISPSATCFRARGAHYLPPVINLTHRDHRPACNLGHHSSKCEIHRDNRSFLLLAPALPPLAACEHLDARHRTVSSTNTSIAVCTNGTTSTRCGGARQCAPNGYVEVNRHTIL